MSGIKTKRQWFVIDGGAVVWQGASSACAWQFAQGRGSGIVCGEWRPHQPESPKVSPRSHHSQGTRATSRRGKPRKSR